MEPVQGLNLNRRSISGLDPAMAVTRLITGECVALFTVMSLYLPPHAEKIHKYLY
jgi:hypothetical protein